MIEGINSTAFAVLGSVIGSNYALTQLLTTATPVSNTRAAAILAAGACLGALLAFLIFHNFLA